MSLEYGRRIAETILEAQSRELQTEKEVKQARFKELPRPVSYYYDPHRYATVEAGETKTLYDFKLPKNRVFHIHQVANNWFHDTYSIWKLDGARVEKVERWISSINSPLVIKDRYLVAYNSVKWITVNNSLESIISETLLDGLVWLLSDFELFIKQRKNL